MRKLYFQWSIQFVLFLIGLGVGLVPTHTSWIPSIIIWSVALIWLVATIIYLKIHRKTVSKAEEDRTSKTRQEKIRFRQEHIEKKQIPDKLLELDTYLANKIKAQNISAKTFISMGKNWFKWYDILTLLFVGITYILPISKRIFARMHVNFVIKCATKMNILLRDYKLGTLPIIEEDEHYKALYGQIINLESGLPVPITIKIYRFISLSILLNCLRLLSPERQYWEELETMWEQSKATKWEYQFKQFKYIKGSFSILLLPLDRTMAILLSEISKDIEGYFIGD